MPYKEKSENGVSGETREDFKRSKRHELLLKIDKNYGIFLFDMSRANAYNTTCNITKANILL